MYHLESPSAATVHFIALRASLTALSPAGKLFLTAAAVADLGAYQVNRDDRLRDISGVIRATQGQKSEIRRGDRLGGEMDGHVMR